MKLKLHGGGHSVRSFIHIDDVVEGTYRAMLSADPGSAFHFSTDQMISIRDLVRRIATKMNEPFEAFVENVDERPGKDAAYWLDSSKARVELGWNAYWALDDALDQVLSWVDSNLTELAGYPHEYIHKK
jgi:dTDP-glucose 4,6-dehydratase